jgi:hypothetical protein
MWTGAIELKPITSINSRSTDVLWAAQKTHHRPGREALGIGEAA